MNQTLTQEKTSTEKQPKGEVVTVVLKPSDIPPFKLKSSLIKNGKLTFKNDHFPGFNVSFELDDNRENSGYRFPTDPDKALAAKPRTAGTNPCPSQGETWPEFKPLSVTNGSTLEVRNLNQNPEEFGFTLFVTRMRNGKEEILMLDPIGDNKNGPRT